MMVLGLIQRVIVFKTDIFSAENYPYPLQNFNQPGCINLGNRPKNK